jgi:tetratricopeptide (TPR) repeat protein
MNQGKAMSEAKKEQDLVNRGNELLGQGNLIEALSTYMEAVQINPKFTPALSQIFTVTIFQLITSYEDCSEFDKAIFWAGYWVEISNRQDPRIYTHLARVLLKNGEIEEAIVNYEKAFNLQPQQPAWVLEQMVQALQQNKQGYQGIFTYEQRIWSNANHGYFFWALGDIYANRNEINKVIVNYQRTLDFLPEESSLYEKLAIIFNQKGDLDQAIHNYKQAISLAPKRFDFYLHLAEIQKQKGDVDQAISNYQQAIRINPNHLFAYRNYFELWSKKDNTEQAVQKCIELSEELCTTNYSLHEFVFNTTQQYGNNDQKCQFINGIPLKEEEGEIFQQIWQNLNHTNIENIKFENMDLNIDPEKVKLYFLKQTCNYKSLNINQPLREEDLLLLDNNGLSFDNLQLNHHITEPMMADRGEFNQSLPKHVLYLVNQNKFQKKLISQNKISCICPFTGKQLYSNTCIPYFFQVSHHCNYFFRFESREVFYLITGYVEGEKIALYFPDSGIIICLRNFDFQYLKFLELSVNSWKSYMVINAKKVAIFLKKDKKFSKKVIIFGELHIGHCLWNKLSGIHQIYEWNQLENIDKFLVGSQPLGKLEDIFPEIPQDKIKSINLFSEEYVDLVIDNNYLPITYGANFVKQDLAERIYQASLQKCSPAVIQEIENAKQQHFPLLWINIRTGSRFWLSQIEGTANIINKLAEDFPNLGIVFDGISLLEGQSKNYSSPSLEAENKIVYEIQNLIHKPVKTYNLIGRIIYENLAWVKHIDLYLSHWGNGLTKPVLIANKPGVVHCNQQALKIPITERWISWHRENCVLPTYISSDDIHDFSVISYDLRLSMNNNYDIDWEVIYQEILKVIPQCERYHSQMANYYKSRLEAIKADLETSYFRLAEIREKLSQISQKDISSHPRS